MLYARLGNTGLLISKLAFGAMTFGSTKGPMASVAKVNEKGADELVGQALDAGVNFFNTADVYSGGQSEQILSLIHISWLRSDRLSVPIPQHGISQSRSRGAT